MTASAVFESGVCLLIAPVPVHCFLITFKYFRQRRAHADSLFKLFETAFEVVNEAMS